MPSIYADFASLPTEIEDFSVGGPAFSGVRPSTTGLGAPTFTALTTRRMVFVAQALEGFARTFPEVLVWKAPWLVFALLGVDIAAGDIFTDGSYQYEIAATPVTHYGFVLAPARVWVGAVPTPTGGSGRRGRWVGIRAIPTYST